MTRRYVITGAQGLVGRYLAGRILDDEADAEVVGLGRSARADGFFTHRIGSGRAPVPPSLRASFDGRYRYRQVSLLDTARLRRLLREVRPDCVFHLASALHTASERALISTNVEGTASLTRALAGSQALLVLGSSGSVYGEPGSVPVAEPDPCRPADMYGVSKLAAEHVARLGAARGRFGWIAARIFNVVGPGQSGEHVCGRIAAQLAAVVDARRPSLDVGALDCTRDFIDVRDVAAALLVLARRGERGGTYNVGSGRETPIRLVLSELIGIAGLEGRIEIVQRCDRPPGVRRHFAEVSRLRLLGFDTARSLVESLEDLFGYHRALDSGDQTAAPLAARV